MSNRYEMTDSQLVSLAQQGERSAFDELITRHRRRCLMLAVSILRNLGEAEEECQNGYLKAYTNLRQFRGDAEFLTWLLRIVESQCLMLLRRRNRVRLVHLDDSESDKKEYEKLQLPSADADPEKAFGNQEFVHTMRREIERIPPMLRRMLLLRDLAEMPMSELADHLGISIPAAKSRLLRARIELRQRMLRHCSSRNIYGDSVTAVRSLS